jgi:hypothetical protein
MEAIFGFYPRATDVEEEGLKSLKCHGRNEPEIDMEYSVEII